MSRKLVLAAVAGLALSFAGTGVARADSLDDMRKAAAAEKAKEEAEEKAKKEAEAKAEAEEAAKKKAAEKAEWDEAKKKAGALKDAMGASKDTMGDALRAKMKGESFFEKAAREKREAMAKKEKEAAEKGDKDSLLSKIADKAKGLHNAYQKGGVKGLAVEGGKMVKDLLKKKDDGEPKERTLMDELKEQREKNKAKNGESIEEMMKRKMGGK